MDDRIERLKALLADENIYDAPAPEPTTPMKYKAHNIYEGSDSEEDLSVRQKIGWNQSTYGTAAPLLFPELGPNDFEEFKLEYGQLAPEGLTFCPWKTVTKYPYSYVGHANRPRVTENFFHGGKCYNQTWDFFYLYRLREDSNQQPILLVPTKQLEYFLAVINKSLGTNLTIPSGSQGGLETSFSNNGTPYPRYLGRAINKKMADDLREIIPARHYKLANEPVIKEELFEASLAAFKAKIERMNLQQKAKKQANKEKLRVERVAKQQSWRNSTKRVQRYLGLRRRQEDVDHAAVHAKLEGQNLDWNQYHDAVQKALAAKEPDTFYDPEKPTKFMLEDAVVFVCIDVEAYELNNNLITEIGIATLDVLDIADMAPGVNAKNWRSAIRARHFRIKEHMRLNNTIHVQGCADRFEFGTSEFIKLADAPRIVGSCFKHPFSKPISPQESGAPIDTPSDEPPPKRNIILVGHDVDSDIRFLRQIGYEVTNLQLHESIDTTLMWRALKREANPRALAAILAELDIMAWNLHNAGNDAVYTLQAMLGIACKYFVDQKMAREKEVAKKIRVAEAVREAAETAMEREEGWSSEGSDGGERITPEKAAAKKEAAAKAKEAQKRPRDVDALWKNGAQVAGIKVSDEQGKPAMFSGEEKKNVGLQNQNDGASSAWGGWGSDETWGNAQEQTTVTASAETGIEDAVKNEKSVAEGEAEGAKKSNPKIPKDISAKSEPWTTRDERYYRYKW